MAATGGGPSEGMINLCMAYEQRTLEALTKPFILPVTIVTGFLGAGKTTLLKSLLAKKERKKRNLRLAALVNDFGAVNHDVQLLGLSSPSEQHHHHHEHEHQHLLGKAERVKGLEGGCMCCAPSLQEGMRGEVWSLLQQPGGAAGPVGEGMVDYLVIETSGVTDPEGLIRALDEKFGKMMRARLDAVVTVVDADALEGGEGVALARQLACADVILLNKVDLLDEARLAAVEQRIRAVNPLAHVHKTRYCDVPLQFVLDVDLPTDGGAGPAMTHEASAAAYTTRAARAEAPTLRSDASRAMAQSGKLATTNLLTGTAAAAPPVRPEHLAADGLASVTFASPAPLLLARLQDFFAHAFPSHHDGGGIVRAKGFLHVRELPGQRLSLSVSGRRRVHIRDEGPWTGAPRTELVLIGRAAAGFDGPGLLAALEGAACGEDDEEEGDEDAAAVAAAHAARLRAVVAEDSRMEVVDPREAVGPLWRRLQRGRGSGGRKRPLPGEGREEEDADVGVALPHWVDAVVAFRVTGAGSLGVTSEHLRLQHGVDMDGLNRALQERVNMAGKPAEGVLLWPLLLPEGKGLALCFAVGPEPEAEARARAAWDGVVAPAAAAVMDERMSHLKLCKCGH